MKKFGLTLLALTLVVVVLSACGGNSLVGTWETESGDTITFTKNKFTDETGISFDYKTKGDKLIIDVPLLGELEMFTFKVSKDKLTVYIAGETVEEYTRK